MARKNERRGWNHNLSCVPPDPHTLASIMEDVYGAKKKSKCIAAPAVM